MSVKQDLIDLEELEKERMKEMGEENYYKWLESKFKVFACNIDTLSILRQVLNKAGYDFIEINTGQSIYLKTHLNKNDYDCIWWVIEDGQIYAHIHIDVKDIDIVKFMDKLEEVTGRTCFDIPNEYTDYISKKNTYEVFKQISKQYNADIQNKICDRIKKNIEESKTMNIENEEILEDDSILITISI